MTIEASNDPKRWVDGSEAEPALVAWQYPDAVEWVREQLEQARGQAEPDNQAVIDDRLATYRPVDTDTDDHYPTREGSYVPTMWEWLANTLQSGSWVIAPFQLSPGRKLVMQIAVFADKGRCAHQRPADKPYLGLNPFLKEHTERYAKAR